jgi:hypothetical protein
MYVWMYLCTYVKSEGGGVEKTTTIDRAFGCRILHIHTCR